MTIQNLNIKKPNTNYQRLTTNFGFTLIELLITLFIMVLLVTLFIPYQRQYAKKNALKNSVQEMKEKILMAQSLALSPQDKNVTYYRFVFYPDDKKYEIRSGNYNLSLPGIPHALIESNPIEGGALPDTISYKSGATPSISINNGTSSKQGTIVFQVIEGKCNFWHNPSENPISYTFSNDIDDQQTLSINPITCAININEKK